MSDSENNSSNAVPGRAVDDDVRQILAAMHAVQIWNYEDDALLQSVEKISQARDQEGLEAWLRARLSHKRPKLPKRISNLAPNPPLGAAFPLTERGNGIGFVSADRFANYPRANEVEPRRLKSRRDREPSPYAELERSAQPVSKLITKPFEGEFPVSVWVPHQSAGQSHGLATLAASLAAVVAAESRSLDRLAYKVAFTGAFDHQTGNLHPVGESTIEAKISAAKRCGFQRLYIVEGQGGVIDDDGFVFSVPARYKSALSCLLGALVEANDAIFDEYDVVRRVADKLKIELRDVEEYLGGVFHSLTNARTLKEVQSDLGFSRSWFRGWFGSGAGAKRKCLTGLEGWKQVVEHLKAEENSDTPVRLLEFCHQMLERHASKRNQLPLLRVTRFLNRQKMDELTHGSAIAQIKDVRRNKNLGLEEAWLKMLLIAGAIKTAEAKDLVFKLLEENDELLTSFAILIVKRFFESSFDDLDELRHKIGTVMGSGDRSKVHLLKHWKTVTCSVDFCDWFGSRNDFYWENERFEPTVKISKYPVSNLDFECFDPSHQDRRTRYSLDDDDPVVNVSWFAAYNFAFWARLRLPTRLEWLSAAIDKSGPYPYQSDDFRAINFGSRSTCPVNRTESRLESSQGCIDMTGNVWEWVMDWSPPRTDQDPLALWRNQLSTRMALGGSWRSQLEDLRLDSFASIPPSGSFCDVGFRCIDH